MTPSLQWAMSIPIRAGGWSPGPRWKPRVVVAGFEDAGVLELGDQGQRHLGADVCHFQRACHKAQVLDGPRTAGTPVGHEPDGLVVPLGVQVVDRVLQDPGGAVVVLRSDDYEPVQRGDPRRPLAGVVVLVLTGRGRHRLVQMRQRIIPQIDQLVLRVPAPGSLPMNPSGDLLSLAVGSGAADDEANPGHTELLNR